MVPPHDVRNDGSAPLEGVGLQVPVPMGSQGADVAETHPASEGEAAGETVQFEHRLPSAVCNNTPLSHPPVATPIVSSANSLPQDTGHCSDTQRESCGEAAGLSNSANTGCDVAGTSALFSGRWENVVNMVRCLI
ncbi:hypothetical protein V6N11_044982 [Hibiscus sabdariffa]|uniref:Uncharacterized protein n=1 Tax=Hibiscus sabdariffa TaxID=183260 RepID=A0ABR2PUG2_9ROSI